MLEVEEFTLVVPGPPVPYNGADKASDGHLYTKPKCREYVERIRAAWMVAGRPVISSENAPIEGWVRSYIGRPKCHYGGLGLREDAPKLPLYKKCGDTDNLDKLPFDALKEYAYEDDRLFVDTHSSKRYTESEPYTEIEVRLWNQKF